MMIIDPTVKQSRPLDGLTVKTRRC